MERIKKKHYRKNKKTTIQLTSLLDLLFVMIFVSLIQQKKIPEIIDHKIKPPGKIIHVKSKPLLKKEEKKEKRKEKKKEKPLLKTHTIDAVFQFHGTSENSQIPKGSYNMKGSFDEKTRSLKLGGVSWVNRPKHYDMVPLSGRIMDNNNVFIGRVEFPGCKEFTLRKVKVSNNLKISGVWKGFYDCSQGRTGLILTVK